MTPAERLDYLVRLAMEAWDAMGDEDPRTRANFEIAVRERLAQGAQVIECQLADAKDAGRVEGEAAVFVKAAERCDREAARAKANVEPSRRDGVSGTPPHWWGFAHAMQEHAEWLRREAAR